MAATQPKDRTIRLIVQANKLYNSDVTDQDIDDYTSLVEDDGLGNGFGDPNKDFETIVFMNKNVCWSIEMNDPNGDDQHYSVSLSKVIHKPNAGNPNFFTSESLDVNDKTGKVCGTISRNPILPDMDDSYTIEFYVGYGEKTQQGGQVSGMIKVELDPKLKISTRG